MEFKITVGAPRLQDDDKTRVSFAGEVHLDQDELEDYYKLGLKVIIAPIEEQDIAFRPGLRQS